MIDLKKLEDQYYYDLSIALIKQNINPESLEVAVAYWDEDHLRLQFSSNLKYNEKHNYTSYLVEQDAKIADLTINWVKMAADRSAFQYANLHFPGRMEWAVSLEERLEKREK